MSFFQQSVLNKYLQQLNDFDKDYMDMMVSDHKDVIDQFEKAAEKCKDTDIRAFAANTLPVLKKHLESAIAINDGLKNTK